MHILITGGSGFLGSALTERLRREGADVTWLSRRASTPAPDGVEVRTYSQLWADDRFDALINKINLNKRPARAKVAENDEDEIEADEAA